MTSVAIMQPTFLPWLGYLDLMDAVDEWVSLDDVQFSYRSWQHRNRIRERGGLGWLTVPVRGDQRRAPLPDVRIGEHADYPARLCARFDESYRAAPHRDLGRAVLDPLAESQAGDRLVDLNHALVERLRAAFEITTPVRLASALDCRGTRTAHLVEICRAVGATTYVTPPGSLDYLVADRGLFDDAGLAVEVQVYDHPTYPQCHSPFLSHASSVDLLSNVGSEAGPIMRSGRRPGAGLADTVEVDR